MLHARAMRAHRVTSMTNVIGFRHGGGGQSPSRGAVAGNHTAPRGRRQPYVYESSIGVTEGSGVFAIWGRKTTARCVPIVDDWYRICHFCSPVICVSDARTHRRCENSSRFERGRNMNTQIREPADCLQCVLARRIRFCEHGHRSRWGVGFVEGAV